MNDSSWAAATPVSPVSPTSGPSRAISQARSSAVTASTAVVSLARAAASPSDSRIPASALMISPSAQKVTPSP